jgi:hypothetical protein
MFSKRIVTLAVSVVGIVFAVSICFGSSGELTWPGCCAEEPICEELPCPDPCLDCDDFTKDFRLQDCWWFQTIGINPYFKLIPGYQLVLSGEELNDEEEIEKICVVITVLWEKEYIHVPGIGWVRARVVEEREWVDCELEEVSRNFFAICKKTNAVYYFGEDVDIYEDGVIVSSEGEWRAGVNGAMPGLIMPGTFLKGARYCQEQAPEDDAVDRGENDEMGLTAPDPKGGDNFTGCVRVVDTNPAEGICDPEDGDEKIYCPGVGLVQDEALMLVDYGFGVFDFDEDCGACLDNGDED